MRTRLTRMLLLFGVCTLATGLAQAGWYAGAGLGSTDSALELGFDLPPSTETDDSGFSWTVFGGYEFGPTLAIEFGYEDLGDDYEAINTLGNDEKINFDVAAFDVTLVGQVKVHDRANFFGRLGVAYWDVELNYVEPGFDSSDCDTDLDMVVGAGFEWQIRKNLGLRFEWKQFQNVGDEVKTDLPPATGGRLQLNGHDINVMGIGVAFGFGD